MRWLNELLLDIDRRRPLPRWKRTTFERWLVKNKRPAAPNGKPVALFNDTFMNYYNPEVGIAALEVLERIDCAVTVVRPGCCGRPFISQGLLKEARAQASEIVEGLFPIAERGEKIVFCEPSCLSAVKEDAPSLLRGEAQKKARAVAERLSIVRRVHRRLDLALKPVTGRILVTWALPSEGDGVASRDSRLLSRIPSATVVDLDAGCCGMAGSFGYHRQHYDISFAIANRRLLPAVKSLGSGDVLVAPGFSCRHQIEDFSDAKPVHPAMLIRGLLK